MNRAILKRLGEPGISGKWEAYTEEAKQKFSQWCYCHRLKLHTLEFPVKYKVLSQFRERGA